jgi:uncharacterized protein YdhG (YjbR/CyaY superfamily)
VGTVTDYLAGIEDEDRRLALEHVMSLAREMVPDAEEGRSYGMPALLHRGKPLVAAVAAKRHLSIYPFSGSIVETVAADLEGFSLSSGTIRFDVDRPVPDDVLRRIIELRMAQIDASR